MAWVTKSSTEEYNTTPEPPKQYTPVQKAGNWWHYHKVIVAVVLVLAAVAAWILYDVVGRPQADYHIGWVGVTDLPQDTVTALEESLVPYCEDLNGDGRVLVEITQFTYDFRADSQADPYYKMAALTRLEGDLSLDDGCYIFLLQDPSGFEGQTGVLQYLDGTLPEDTVGDWRQMVYLWSDCPVLAGLDLGSYTGLTQVDQVTGSSQQLLSGVYVGRRGNWAQDNAYFDAGDALWDKLTAGATPLPADAQQTPLPPLAATGETATAEAAAG